MKRGEMSEEERENIFRELNKAEFKKSKFVPIDENSNELWGYVAIVEDTDEDDEVKK